MPSIICLYAITTLMFEITTGDIPTEPLSCEIFCRGKLLDVVQRSGMFRDPKIFVDMTIKYSHEKVLRQFNKMMNETRDRPSLARIIRFVRNYFIEPGQDYEEFKPVDWVSKPKFLSNIKCTKLRKWAKEVHALWKRLCIKVKSQVLNSEDKYSMLYVPNPVTISGVRHREFYYFDTYWITLGLLRSEMYTTCKGMIENLLWLVKRYGYVPSGGRIYHLNRTHPPLLIPIVNNYLKVTNDIAFVKRHIDKLEMEFAFWMENRVVEIKYNNKILKLAKYNAPRETPRPDYYSQDLSAAKMLSDEDKKLFYHEIASACESGWAFSSRWFNHSKKLDKTFSNINVTKLIPVDLNAILCWNANILSQFWSKLGMKDKADKYKNISDTWRKSMETLLWCESDGIWYDYDSEKKEKRNAFYATNLFPLWTGCYDKNKGSLPLGVVRYLKKISIINYKGGIPASKTDSGLMYDLPNVIPPLQYIMIHGLHNSGNEKAKELALKLAKKWIRVNFYSYESLRSMFSFYSALSPGQVGTSLLYVPDVGFGWTNGVCLELLALFGDKLDAGGNTSFPNVFYISIFIWLLYIHYLIN